MDIFFWVFLVDLRPHPAKFFLVPRLKNLQKSHFQAIFGSKLDTVAQTISKNPVENFCPGTQLYFDEIFQKGQRHFKGTGYGCIARSSQKDRLPTYCLRPQLQTAAQDCSCLGRFFKDISYFGKNRISKNFGYRGASAQFFFALGNFLAQKELSKKCQKFPCLS